MGTGGVIGWQQVVLIKLCIKEKNHLGLKFEDKTKGINKHCRKCHCICRIKIENQFSVLQNNPFILIGGM